MKTKFLLSMAALLTLTTAGACSQTTTPSAVNKKPATFNQTVPGSYIVKATGDGATTIRRVFAQYGVMLVLPLGNEQFELRLHGDPGLDALKNLAARSDGAVITIQPNFVYHSD